MSVDDATIQQSYAVYLGLINKYHRIPVCLRRRIVGKANWKLSDGLRMRR